MHLLPVPVGGDEDTRPTDAEEHLTDFSGVDRFAGADQAELLSLFGCEVHSVAVGGVGRGGSYLFGAYGVIFGRLCVTGDRHETGCVVDEHHDDGSPACYVRPHQDLNLGPPHP